MWCRHWTLPRAQCCKNFTLLNSNQELFSWTSPHALSPRSLIANSYCPRGADYGRFTPHDKTQLGGRVESCRAVRIGHNPPPVVFRVLDPPLDPPRFRRTTKIPSIIITIDIGDRCWCRCSLPWRRARQFYRRARRAAPPLWPLHRTRNYYLG